MSPDAVTVLESQKTRLRGADARARAPGVLPESATARTNRPAATNRPGCGPTRERLPLAASAHSVEDACQRNPIRNSRPATLGLGRLGGPAYTEAYTESHTSPRSYARQTRVRHGLAAKPRQGVRHRITVLNATPRRGPTPPSPGPDGPPRGGRTSPSTAPPPCPSPRARGGCRRAPSAVEWRRRRPSTAR